MQDLTNREKIAALVEYGLASDEADARAQLEDMGELGDDDDSRKPVFDWFTRD